VYPVERSLHIRRPLSSFHDIGIRSDSKTDAVHDARESDIGCRQDVNIGPHSRFNVRQLSRESLPWHQRARVN